MDELAAFQSDLLDLLQRGVRGQALRDAIRSAHGDAYASWVDSFDERAEDVAVRIVQRFARRTAVVGD